MTLRTDLPYDGYGRVSDTGDRGDRLRSPQFQKRDIRAAAKQRDVKVGRIFIDLDASGGKEDREGLTEAIERIEGGRSAGIIVAKLDRFSRDVEQALRLAKRIEDAGGVIVSFAEPADRTTPDGVYMVTLQWAMAQHVRDRARVYFADGREEAVRRGYWLAPLVPLGFRLPSRPGILQVDERWKPVALEAFELAAEGAGPSDVADLLAAKGARTAMGSTSWSRQAVAYMLRNEAYIGVVKSGEFVNADAHEAIVDRALFEAVNRPGRKVNTRGDSYLLSGLVRCWHCRYAMQGTVSSRGKRRYRCTRRHAAGICPHPVSVSADELDALVVGKFFELVGDLSATSSAKPADVEALDVALRRAERALEAWRDDDEAMEALGRPSWLDGLRERQRRVEEARAALGEACAEAAAPDIPPVVKLRSSWDAMPVKARQKHLAAVLDVVAVRGALPDVIVWTAGAGPEVPRRGFRERPELRPFDVPH